LGGDPSGSEGKAPGRKAFIGKLEKLFQDGCPSSERFEDKKSRSKARTAKILAKVITSLASTTEGQKELLLQFAAQYRVHLESDEGETSAKTVEKLRLAFEMAASPYERNYVLQFVNHLTLEKLQGYGFKKLTKQILQRSRGMGSLPYARPQREVTVELPNKARKMRSRKILNVCKKNSVTAWASGAADHCTPEDNRRVLTKPIWSLAREAEARGICAASTFASNLPAKFVKPSRKTDMCRYCDDVRQRGRQPGVLRELEYHKGCATRQEQAFRDSISQACAEGSHLLVIRLDYKGGTILGHSAVERDDCVYGLGKVRICGFVAWFHCPALPMPLYVDAVSGVLDSDSSVSSLLLKMVVQKLAQHTDTRAALQEVESVMLWSDCGQHFRSQVFVRTALWESFSWLKKVTRVTVIFFAEKHGKGECDQHFSVLERYKVHYELHMKRIENVQDFIAALEAVVTAKNALRRLAGEREVWWQFVPYGAVDIPKVPKKGCCLPSIQSTYCISRERCQRVNELWNLIFSDGWAARNETQRFLVTTSEKAGRKPVREASGVKAIQVANIARLRRKRELHERVLAGAVAHGPEMSSESSDDSAEAVSAESEEAG
jgi:hypothetical protein